MKKDMDELLKHALTPKEEPDFWLNRKIISMANVKSIEKERERMERERESMARAKGMAKVKSMTGESMTKGKTGRMRRIPALILSTVVVLGIGSVGVYALGRYLTPEQVAEHVEDKKLTEAFLGKDAIAVNETQNYAGYNVTLLGLVSGESITEYIGEADGKVFADQTYSVVAIEKADGTPMPETSEDAYNELSFFVSPLIKGLNPVNYNIATFHGGYTEFVKDGILYRLSECDNVECFADKGSLLCVTDTTFYNHQAYIYDERTGEISRNEAYEGVNALFALPIDPAKVNPAEAEKRMAEVETSAKVPDKKDVEADVNGEIQTGETEAEIFVQNLTPENIDEYCEPVESTRQTVTPDAKGNIYVEWEVDGRGSGDSMTNVDWAFPDKTPGMDKNFGWSASDGKLESLTIQTYTIKGDGSYTFMIYVPKK